MIILTVAEIIDLVACAGFTLDPAQIAATDSDELETEITIEQCPTQGIADDDGMPRHYEKIAYFTEYPEEGAIGIGKEVTAPIPGTQTCLDIKSPSPMAFGESDTDGGSRAHEEVE